MSRAQLPGAKLKTAHEIAFSPAEDRVAFIGGRDATVLSIPAFKPVFAVHPIANPSHIDFSPDGSRLAVKNTSGHTVVLDAKTGRVLSDFHNQKEGEGASALFSCCSRYVVSVSWHGLLSVRDSAASELLFTHVDQDCMLSELSTPQDRRFFAYSLGRRPPSDYQSPPPETIVLRPWPIRKNGESELPKRWSFIGGLRVSPSGRLLGVIHGAPPEKLEVYDIKRSRVIGRRRVPSGGTRHSIAWSPDERLLGVNSDHSCLVLEMPSLTVRHEIPLRYSCYVGFSPSSRFLALGSWTSSFIVPMDHLAAFAESRR
jgi:hypothetical protein